MLCSVVKQLGSGRALKKEGETLDYVSCFPLHFFCALPLPVCFTTEQNTVEASLFAIRSDENLIIILIITITITMTITMTMTITTTTAIIIMIMQLMMMMVIIINNYSPKWR